MARDYYAEARSLAASLRAYSGVHAEHADRIGEAISSGFTATEILMGIRMRVLELLRDSGAPLPLELVDSANDLTRAIDESLQIANDQQDVCLRFGATPMPVSADLVAGVSANLRDGTMPINGLRHPLVGESSGWYIWAGEELPDDPDFFAPLHISHLADWCPSALPYLALPPGWRFQIAPGHEDVWQDLSLLEAKD